MPASAPSRYSRAHRSTSWPDAVRNGRIHFLDDSTHRGYIDLCRRQSLVSAPRFDEPFYYGRLGHMAMLLIFDCPGWLRFFSKQPVIHPEDLKKSKLFVWAGDTKCVSGCRWGGREHRPQREWSRSLSTDVPSSVVRQFDGAAVPGAAEQPNTIATWSMADCPKSGRVCSA